uniref:ORF5 protein n=1 Tax=Bat Coronavirus PaGD17 TaxID=3018868 RepID=A0AA49EDA8_9NIDO|nr:ORF5 protein [Bat Coronavirus PaGD17]
MAFQPSLFQPVVIQKETHGGEPNGIDDVIACIPLTGYVAALVVNACFYPLLCCLPYSSCRASLCKTLVLYVLMLYNFILSCILVQDTQQPVGICLMVYCIILMAVWTIDRVRFCLMIRSLRPLIDMRSNFIRVNTVAGGVVIPVNYSKPWFVKNFNQRCRCTNCFFAHSATYLECTFISRFSKTTLVSISDFQLNGSHSTVFVPFNSRDSVPLHIIAPSVLTV